MLWRRPITVLQRRDNLLFILCWDVIVSVNVMDDDGKGGEFASTSALLSSFQAS